MRALTRVALVVMLVVTGTGSAGEAAQLLLGQDVIIGASLPDVRAGRPQSLGGWVMCLDRTGMATIEKVELLRPRGGIVLQAFSWRLQGSPMLGNAEAPLTELDFPTRGAPITSVCSQPWPHIELGLQYANTGQTTGLAEGVRLTYTSEGERKTVDFALIVQLCTPEDTRTGNCRDLHEVIEAQE
jgi:hypothetical protein